MSLTIDEKFNLLKDFVEITSDKVIREAAYPRDEWVENGGHIADRLLSHVNSYSFVSIQDNPPEIIKKTGLLYSDLKDSERGVVKQNPLKRAQNIALHWKKVWAHPCYIRFHDYNNSRLRCAVETFKKKAKRNKAAIALKSDLALFRFYNLYAQFIESYLIFQEKGYRRRYADAKTLTKAKNHIEKLQKDFRDGLKLRNNHHQLETLLKQLAVEIEQAPRKDKETPTAAKRRALLNFAFFSIQEFGETSATILGNFAEILGWDNASNSTMDEIVVTAKDKYDQFIGKTE